MPASALADRRWQDDLRRRQAGRWVRGLSPTVRQANRPCRPAPDCFRELVGRRCGRGHAHHQIQHGPSPELLDLHRTTTVVTVGATTAAAPAPGSTPPVACIAPSPRPGRSSEPSSAMTPDPKHLHHSPIRSTSRPTPFDRRPLPVAVRPPSEPPAKGPGTYAPPPAMRRLTRIFVVDRPLSSCRLSVPCGTSTPPPERWRSSNAHATDFTRCAAEPYYRRAGHRAIDYSALPARRDASGISAWARTASSTAGSRQCAHGEDDVMLCANYLDGSPTMATAGTIRLTRQPAHAARSQTTTPPR